jgi:hypothetical protein
LVVALSSLDQRNVPGGDVQDVLDRGAQTEEAPTATATISGLLVIR